MQWRRHFGGARRQPAPCTSADLQPRPHWKHAWRQLLCLRACGQRLPMQHARSQRARATDSAEDAAASACAGACGVSGRAGLSARAPSRAGLAQAAPSASARGTASAGSCQLTRLRPLAGGAACSAACAAAGASAAPVAGAPVAGAVSAEPAAPVRKLHTQRAAVEPVPAGEVHTRQHVWPASKRAPDASPVTGNAVQAAQA